MEKQGLVSVIIPVYNVEKYLDQCLKSVFKQCYQNIEIILVDDGSKDSSGKMCDEYAGHDTRIKVIHQKNAGAAAARNAGLRIVAGEYIYFLDSDDWLEDSALAKFVDSIETEKAEMLFFDAYAVDEESERISQKHYSHKKRYVRDNGLTLMEEMLANKEFHVAPWSMFFRKDFLSKYDLSFEEGIIYEDMVFAYQVFCKANIVTYVPEYLYFRRYRENSVMTSKVGKKNFISACKVYECVRNYSVKCNTYIIRCAYNVLNVYERLNSEDKRAFHGEYEITKKQILKENAYGDKALKLRCYGKIWWFIYKVFRKVTRS